MGFYNHRRDAPPVRPGNVLVIRFGRTGVRPYNWGGRLRVF